MHLVLHEEGKGHTHVADVQAGQLGHCEVQAAGQVECAEEGQQGQGLVGLGEGEEGVQGHGHLADVDAGEAGHGEVDVSADGAAGVEQGHQGQQRQGLLGGLEAEEGHQGHHDLTGVTPADGTCTAQVDRGELELGHVVHGSHDVGHVELGHQVCRGSSRGQAAAAGQQGCDGEWMWVTGR